MTLILMTGVVVLGNWRQGVLLDATSAESKNSRGYERASFLMALQVANIQSTLLDPDGEERAEADGIAARLTGALDDLGRDQEHSEAVRQLPVQNREMQQMVSRYFSLLDLGETDSAQDLLEQRIEPVADELHEVLELEKTEHLAEYTAVLDQAKTESRLLRLGTLFAFLLGLAVLSLLWWSNRAHQRAMERVAGRDALTALPNRLAFNARTERALAAASGTGRQPTMLMLDLDGFKEVNDSLGHHVGDLLLVAVAHRIQGCVRDEDTVARLGGDEFAVLLVDAEPGVGERTADRIGRALSTPIVVEEVTLDIEASIGIATAEPGQDVSLVLRRADTAMYTAKEHRLGHVRFDPQQAEDTTGRLNLLGALRRALDAGEIELHYQPKIAVDTGEVIGAEALARWQHANGPIEPDRFIPILESTSLIHTFTEYVIDLALAQVRTWTDAGHRIPVAVNVSTRSLLERTFPDVIAAALAAHGVPGELLAIEITESTVMADPDRAIEVLHRIRALGVKTSIDDFGTGYSSMSYLKSLPVDELKIDRSFVFDMATDRGNRVLVESTVELGHNLGLAVLPKGSRMPPRSRRSSCWAATSPRASSSPTPGPRQTSSTTPPTSSAQGRAASTAG